MTTALPPMVSEKSLAAALDGFVAALGSAAVLTSEAQLAEFRDPFAHATWDSYTASAVVMPTTVEEIQAVLRVANEQKVPLWTHSQGRNNGYGGPAPHERGSVIVSLRNMNRVLEIDEQCAYAVVEPGVRWFDLYDAIRAGGHKLWLSIADLGWGSVIGNTLDHGVTYLPYGQDMAAQCGMEVVLANGDVLRTGMGAMPGNKSWHLYKRGLGPTPDQLFMQSNYGIVTKMGVWQEYDIGPVVDTLRTLLLDGTIEGVPSLYNTLCLGSVLSSRSQWYDGEGPIPDPVIDRIARELEIGRWIIRSALWGDDAVVEHNFAKIKAAFEQIPGAEVWGTKHDPEAASTLEHPADLIQAGVPNLGWNNMTAWYGGEEGGHIGFSPIAPLTGGDARKLRDLLRGLIEERAGLDYIAANLAVSARSFAHVTLIIFDTKDTARLLVTEAAKQGYGEYRAHLDFMDIAADQYSFNDHAYRRFTETIKDALDPNGILSPGKQGIWPAHMRNGR